MGDDIVVTCARRVRERDQRARKPCACAMQLHVHEAITAVFQDLPTAFTF